MAKQCAAGQRSRPRWLVRLGMVVGGLVLALISPHWQIVAATTGPMPSYAAPAAHWADSIVGQAVAQPVTLRVRVDDDGTGSAAGRRVEFVAWWPKLGPEDGAWQPICDEAAPAADGAYACVLQFIGVTPGPMKVGFNVIEQDGTVTSSPDGVQAFTYTYDIPQGCEGSIVPVREIQIGRERGNEVCGRGPAHLYWFDADVGLRLTVSVPTGSPKSPPLVWLGLCDRWANQSCVKPAVQGIQCTDAQCFRAERQGYGPVTRLDEYRLEPGRALDARQLLYEAPAPGRYIILIEAERPEDDAKYTLKLSPAWCYYAERAAAGKCPY